jgi:hypothetical protein
MHLLLILQGAQAPNALTLNRVALGLFVICAGALALDAVKGIRSWGPIDRADWLGDFLYVPEALYCIGLTVVMLGGRALES